MASPFLVVTGNIGAGKSTLTGALARALSCKAWYENYEENPYLQSYYQDMPRWALNSQLFFLTDAIEQQRRIIGSARGAVQDRSIYEHYQVFAHDLHRQGIITQDDFQLIVRLYESVRSLLAPPDLLIYLRVPAREAHRRLTGRGRHMESAIDLPYLESLERRYEAFIDDWDASPVLTIDGLTTDPRDPEHLQRIITDVTRTLRAPVQIARTP